MSRRIAAVIPALDAGPSVGQVVTGTREIVPEVLVVDDGSTDDTAAAAAAAGAEVVRHDVNRGKGAALRTAFGLLFERGYDAVVTLDADGQHLPTEIPKLLAGWRDDVDLVLGTRGHLYAAMSRLRRTSNTLSSRGISILAGELLEDIQTGFRLYTPRLVATTGFPEDRFEAESAVVVRTLRRGLKLACVPIELGFADGRTTSHYRPLLDSLRIARAVFRARWDSRLGSL